METLHRGISLSICLAAAPLLAQTGTTAKPSDAKDTITFSNGDTLTGKVGKVTYGNVSFHSDELGGLTIPLSKIEAMQTSTVFAAGSKTQRLTRKNLAEQVPVGTVAIAGGTLSVKPAQGEVRSFPVKDLSFMPSRITSSSTKTSR